MKMGAEMESSEEVEEEDDEEEDGEGGGGDTIDRSYRLLRRSRTTNTHAHTPFVRNIIVRKMGKKKRKRIVWIRARGMLTNWLLTIDPFHPTERPIGIDPGELATISLTVCSRRW